MGTVP
jgi:hypothetical protein